MPIKLSRRGRRALKVGLDGLHPEHIQLMEITARVKSDRENLENPELEACSGSPENAIAAIKCDDDAVLHDMLANNTVDWNTILMAVLRSLERQGLIERRLGVDGQPRWHITAKGANIDPDNIGGVELRDFPLD